MKIILRSALLSVALAAISSLPAATDVKTLGIRGDGVTDDTAALQQALGRGQVELVFSPGTYLIGTVNVPSHVTLKGEPGARIRVNPEKITTYDAGEVSKTNIRCVFALKGGNITLRDFAFDFSLIDDDGVAPEKRPAALIHGENQGVLRFIGLTAERPQPYPPILLAARQRERYDHVKAPANKTSFHLASLRYCTDVVMDGCSGAFLSNMLDLYHCARVWALNNRGVDSNAITYSRGGEEFLWHMRNWSSGVRYQCRFWGGNSNDTRGVVPGSPGADTATVVKRGSRDSDADFNPFTVGAYDIFVVNNYAEYGRTLAWGSKGRRVLFQGNIGRFTTDYVLGIEGCEEAIFNGNIVVNGETCGLAAYYWSEKLVISGNIVLVQNEPIDMEKSWFPTPEKYQGGLIRLHAAGASHKSGSGQAIISGNLLVSELSDRARAIRIEAGRDVQIINNKIRNGAIFTRNGSGHVTIANNDFEMTLSSERPWVQLASELKEAVVRGNTFRSTVDPGQRAPSEVLIRADADGAKAGFSLVRIIEGNLAGGFPLTLQARAFSQGTPDRFLIRDNTFSGTIRFEGLASAAKTLLEGNVNLETLEPATVERLTRIPQTQPESATEDEATPLSDDGNLEK